MTTRYIDNSTIKRLFAESRGICAKCGTDLFPEGNLVGEFCHIEAYSAGGNRYNKLLKKENRENQYENLIVLCANCHKIIDLKQNEELYNVVYLNNLKENHRKKQGTESNPEMELDERTLEFILNSFSTSIEKELLEIKSILNLISENHCFQTIQERFKRKNIFSPSIENIESFFFSMADLKVVDTIKKGIELNLPQSYILIGPPSSGKTTLMLKIAKELPEILAHFYLSLNEGYSLNAIRRDLRSLNKIQSILYLDDCHLDNDLACEIYYECSNYENITLIFLYREIDEVAKVSESGYNLFENTVSEIFRIDPFTNQKEKINMLIDNRIKRISETKKIDALTGNRETVYNLINKNLLKLSLLLDEWEKQPNELLDQINDSKLNRLLFKRFINTRYEKPEQDFLKVYTTINKYEIPFKILDDTNLETHLLEDALANKNEEREFNFFHSTFANLLLLSLLSEDSKFNLRFPNGLKEFELASFKEYLLLLTNINPKKYPYKLGFILNKILANRGFELFKLLMRDGEMKERVVRYFKSTWDNAEYSTFFKNIAVSSSNYYNYYYNHIMDSSKVKEILSTPLKNIMELRNVMYLLKDKSYQDFKDTILRIPKEQIKTMIMVSGLNESIQTFKYLYNLDKSFASYIFGDITIEEWALLITQAPISIIPNAIIDISRIKGSKFVENIWFEVDTEKIIFRSKREQLDHITQLIKVVIKVNQSSAKKMLALLSEQYIEERVHNQPIGKISKCFKELYPYKKTEITSIVGKISDDELLAGLENYSLLSIGRVVSEIHDINKEKISSLEMNPKFKELLLYKLKEADNLEQIGKGMSDFIRKLPYSAKLLVYNLEFEKIEPLINNSTIIQCAEFIYAVFKINGYNELAANLYKSIPSESLAEKTYGEKFKIAHFETTFSQLNRVNGEKTKEILDFIDTEILISKSIDLKVSARIVSQSLKPLSFISPETIKRVLAALFNDARFNRKINELSKADLLLTFANFLDIDFALSIDKFTSIIESLNAFQLKNERISALSDVIRLLKKKLNLTKESPLIKVFEAYLLDSYKNFPLRQISSTLINLSSIDAAYASNLITKLDLEILTIKAHEVSHDADLKGCLGEIRAVNPEYGELLMNEILKR